MCGYFCIVLVDFMLKSKSLWEYTNLFSRNEYKKNEKTILEYFQWWKSIVISEINIENLKTQKDNIFKKQSWGLSIPYSKYGLEYKKIFKENKSVETSKTLGVITNT